MSNIICAMFMQAPDLSCLVAGESIIPLKFPAEIEFLGFSILPSTEIPNDLSVKIGDIF